MNDLVLFSIHPIFLFAFIFLGGIILKIKKFVIQWRNFEFKRSYILKVIDLWTSWTILDFIWFLSILFLYLKRQKGDIFHRNCRLRWCGPAWMQHGMQSHVVELRKPTQRLGGTEETQTRGRGHAWHGRMEETPRRCPSGATWHE